MNAIQFLLVAAAVLWLASYLAQVRTQGLARLVAVVAAFAGITLVLFPGLSVRLAKLLGVTRGVDLVIYLSLVGIGFLWLQLATRMRALEGQLTELVRRIALDRAADPRSTPAQAAEPERPPATRS